MYVLPIIIELYSSIGNIMHFVPPHKPSLNNAIYSDRTFRDTPTENANPLLYDPPYNPKGNHIKSRPISKPSIGNSIETSPQAGRNINTISNSCFVGNPPSLSQKEAKTGRNIRQGQDQPFLSLSINNLCRFPQNTPLLDQLYQERRKSESTYSKSSHPVQDTLLKSQGEPISMPIKQKDPVVPNESALRDMIEQLSKRVANSEQQITKLKEKTEKDKRTLHPDGDLKEFKGKLLQLAKFNSKHFTDYESRLENQQKMMEEIQKKTINYNAIEYLKKTNILQAKLNELYEGFKIKADHNQREISIGLQSLQQKLKDYIRVQIGNIQQNINESKGETSLHSRILKIQAEIKQKTWYNINQLQRSNQKCHHWKTIQSKETLLIKKDPSKEKPKSKFINTPRNWVYQTPNKENIDTPIKGLNFQEHTQEVVIREETYYVDPQGYLLDENKYYLLNSQNQQILLPPSMLACLRQNDMLRA